MGLFVGRCGPVLYVLDLAGSQIGGLSSAVMTWLGNAFAAEHSRKEPANGLGAG
jgi:hypothetical protein